MNLLPNETILRESSGKSLTLTTHRIRFQTETFGSARVQSIMLEELASCALVKNSQPLFLVLAGLSVVIGLFLAGNARGDGAGIFIISLVIAGIFVLAYFLNQQQIIAFASAGTTIRVNTQGMKLEDAKNFIDDAETAKNARYLLLAK